MIRIIDCGSQLTQNIARRVRELRVYTEIVPFNTPVDKIKGKNLEGIIISGGPFSVYDTSSPMHAKEVLDLGVPVLGICYGQQSITYLLGGKVSPATKREYGETRIRLNGRSRLFNDVPFYNEFTVWMSHGDIVEKLPYGFEVFCASHETSRSSSSLFLSINCLNSVILFTPRSANVLAA